MKWLAVTILATAAAVMVVRQRQAEADAQGQGGTNFIPDYLPDLSMPSLTDWPAWTGMQSDDDQPDQLTSPLEDLVLTAKEFIAPPPAAFNAVNRRAVLDMIAYAEGTAGPEGYATLFGGGKFTSFADHPRQRFQFTNKLGQTLTTTAAGRYQFLSRTWDALRAKLSLPDFGPESQDLAALELIRERGALGDVDAGRITVAIGKIAKVWASLPGAGYAQPERKLSSLLAQYRAAGGNLEA